MKLSTLYVDAPWKYERIENSTHWIQVDQPERLNALLVGYLGKSLGQWRIEKHMKKETKS